MTQAEEIHRKLNEIGAAVDARRKDDGSLCFDVQQLHVLLNVALRVVQDAPPTQAAGWQNSD